MPKLLSIGALILCTVLSFAQEQTPLAEAARTTCDYPAGGISEWVTSKLGYSAAVELRSKISGAGNKRACTTTWTLNLREKSGAERLVVAEREDKPEDNEWMQENTFEIIAWSREGSALLTAQIEAQGDADDTTPIIYDFKTRKVWRVPLHPLFEKNIPNDCYVVYRPLRFETQSSIVIEATSTDTDREEGTPPCFHASKWQLNYRTKALRRLKTAPEAVEHR